MNLTKNFKLEEFTKSTTADKYGIDNTPSEIEIKRLRVLCKEVLQPARDYFTTKYGKGAAFIKITSGYRTPELSKKIGSSENSFHNFGYAADCELYVLDNITEEWVEMNELLFNYIKDNLPFTELIDEYNFRWVHVAYNPDDSRTMVKKIS